MTSLTRRHILAGASAATASSLMPRLSMGSALAAETSGYKALVCVFFKGGMDGHDVVLPYDQSSYSQFREARRSLMDAYGQNAAGRRRTRPELLELAPRNAADFGGRAFALPPELRGLHDLFGREKASIVSNVGPLVEPMSRTQFRDRTRARPKSLFSHNDQQSTWMAMSPEGARRGWGGQFADQMVRANANLEPNFSAISVSGQSVFLSGDLAQGFQISENGAARIDVLERGRVLGPGRNSPVAAALLAEHMEARGTTRRNLFERDIARVARRSVEVNARFDQAIEQTTPFLTPFPDTRLGRRLGAIAQSISARGIVGAQRQVFFAAMGGFDSHSSQAQNLPDRQQEIGDAIAAFYAATEEMGVANDVTLFTASDFGRTLTANGDGTDHGWGSHHFVVGGDINGGQIFGDIPPPVFDHELDSGRGRLIPTTSVEQFASPLGRWFGLSPAELASVFPRQQVFAEAPALV